MCTLDFSSIYLASSIHVYTVLYFFPLSKVNLNLFAFFLSLPFSSVNLDIVFFFYKKPLALILSLRPISLSGTGDEEFLKWLVFLARTEISSHS